MPRLVVLGAGPAQLGALRAARRARRADDRLRPATRRARAAARARRRGRAGLDLRRRRRRARRPRARRGRADRAGHGLARCAWPPRSRRARAAAPAVARRRASPRPTSARSAPRSPAPACRSPRWLEADAPFDRPVVVKPASRRASAASRASSAPRSSRRRSSEPASSRATARRSSRSWSTATRSPSTRFLHDGFHAIAVTDRERASAFGVATAHLFPARAGAGRGDRRGRRPRARRSASSGGRSTCRSCSAPDGPRVMEVAARLGGGHDAELCLAATGIDLATLAVHAALGERDRAVRALARAGGRARSCAS